MNSDPWGGSEEQWFAVAKYIAKQNFNVSVLVYYWKDKEQKMNELRLLGATIYYIPNKGRSKKNLKERLYFEWITRLQQKIFIHKFSFNKFTKVIVNQGGFMEVCNSPWKHVYQKLPSYILTFHNYFPEYVFPTSKKNILIHWLKKANFNVGDALKIGTVLKKQLQLTDLAFQSIVNPITIPYSNSYTKFAPLKNGKYVIVMLAQLDVSRKAQDNLIKALQKEDWKSRNAIFELYGGGTDWNYLNSLIESLNLQHLIVLKGNTNAVDTVLTEAHLVLQITHKDAMPISVVEAMSKSRAVIVSEVGDMPEWVLDGYNGYIAANASIEQIDAVLEKAWQNRNNWEEMGRNAYNTFKEKFPNPIEAYFYNKFLQ